MIYYLIYSKKQRICQELFELILKTIAKQNERDKICDILLEVKTISSHAIFALRPELTDCAAIRIGEMLFHGLLGALPISGLNGVQNGNMLLKDNFTVDRVIIHRLHFKPEIMIQEHLTLTVHQLVMGGSSDSAVKTVIDAIQKLSVSAIQIFLQILQCLGQIISFLLRCAHRGQFCIYTLCI